MEVKEKQLIGSLSRRNGRMRRLMENHIKYEEILGQFNSRFSLNTNEQVERKRIQKLKLAGRDEMQRIISHYEKEINTHIS